MDTNLPHNIPHISYFTNIEKSFYFYACDTLRMAHLSLITAIHHISITTNTTMKAPTATLLLLLLTSILTLTSAHQQHQPQPIISRIVGGNESTPDAYSFMAGFWVQENPDQPFLKITCGGSLVAPQIVLTAAHCKFPNEDVKYFAYLGDHDVSSLTNDDEEGFSVEEVLVHPEYNETYELENDLMLLRLKEDTSEFMPLELASSFPSDGVATVAGWGLLEFEGNMTDVMMEADVSVLSVEECDDYLMNKSMPPYPDGNGFLCAQGNGTDACGGDSGGPLFYSDGGVFKQVGVVSWGNGCADPEHPGIYADVPYYMDWLTENIADMSSRYVPESSAWTVFESGRGYFAFLSMAGVYLFGL